MSGICMKMRLPVAGAFHLWRQTAVTLPIAFNGPTGVNYISSHINSPFLSNPMKFLPSQDASFSTSVRNHLKEIQKTTEGNTTIVEGKYVESPHSGKVVFKPNDEKVCPLCALNLNLKHTDVLVLSQFVRPNGQLLPRRITGLCCVQQTKLTKLVTMSKKAGLMPNLAPANSHKDPAKRRGSKKLHRFFDEATIRDTTLRNVARYREIRYTK